MDAVTFDPFRLPCGHARGINAGANNDCRTCRKPAVTFKAPRAERKRAAERMTHAPFCAACESGEHGHGNHPCLRPVAPSPNDFCCACLTSRPMRRRRITR